MVGLSYADAVLLMGGRNNRTVAALDRLAGGALLAASVVSGGFALNLFEAKGELVQLSGELVRELGQRIRGLDRFTRGERLAAAHSIVVLTAYFEVLAGTNFPFDVSELRFTKAEQVMFAGGGPSAPGGLADLAARLLRAEVPMPVPQRSHQAMLEGMRAFYQDLSAEVSRFVSGLAIWDRLGEAGRARLNELLSRDLPGRAVARYEERFRQLAVEFPEIAFWANQVDHQATQAGIRRLGTGMAGLERMLADIAAGRVPDDRHLGLSRAYRAVLQRPVLTTADAPPGLSLPVLGDAYVNPDFRAVEATGSADQFADESWWEGQRVRDDLEEFLFGYLMSPHAVEAPLLVLGQPGSGKSVLTQVLAAQLPPDSFLPVRVVLREAAAGADLQTQIEDAVRSATGESLTWPALVRSASGALPVVLLDGFDELLQATGVSQTDYLSKVADFQAREAHLDRPVAILVTSRSAVADRAKPPPGMVVVRLEPFRGAQISQWLKVWNNANARGLASRGLRPLTAQTLLDYSELASQPLLLLMLALYDADDNRLQRAAATLHEAELYEQLLVSFAEREVRKSGADLSGRQAQDAVELELLRLSVVAIAMFSRSRQWISDAELDADLPALLGPTGSHGDPSGFRAPLSAAQVVVGRFYFIHEAQATRDSIRVHTYEFLHATFGEYLIARLVTRELEDLAAAAQLAAARTRPEPVDDSFLHALLSHMPLTKRGSIVSFAAERIRALPQPHRHQLLDVLLKLFGSALGPRQDSRYRDYVPVPVTVPARYAAYSANLVILAVLAAGELAGSSLFPEARDPATDWRNLALLWRSQLPRDGWEGLIGTLALDRTWQNNHQRDVVLRYSENTGQRGSLDPLWSDILFVNKRMLGGPYGWRRNRDSWLRDQAWFVCDTDDDTAAHALEPFGGDHNIVCSFHRYWPESGQAMSTANALITLWLASSSDCSPDELARAYDTCLEIAIHARFAPTASDLRVFYRTLVFRQLAADRQRVPPSWLNTVTCRIKEAANATGEATEKADLLRIASQFLPELATAPQS